MFLRCCMLFSLLAPHQCGSALSAWGSACQFGGLVVTKSGRKVDDDTCDWVYPKEEWQPPQPDIQYPAADQDEMYTVLTIDPDAPGHPNGIYYLHMIQANMKGADLKTGDFSKALELAPYVGPAPPPGTGLHRYMFVVYKHNPGFLIKKEPTPERWMFNLGKWLAGSGRGLIGPEAGVQFKSGP